MRASLEGAGEGSSVSVAAHVAGIGWQDAASAPSYAGTVGQGRAVQAVRVSLSGPVSERYDVWYRVHAAGYGWLGWAKDGASAGTVGLSKAVQAVQVVLVPKGGAAPGPAGGAFRGAGERLSGSSISVAGSPAGSSFSGGVLTLGSERGPVLGSVAATVDNLESDGSVCYRGLLLGSGWQGETSSDGAQLGASGGGLQLKAVRFELSGGLAERYDVWYRSCDSARGWQDEVSGGAVAGTTGQGRAVECVKMRLTGDLSEYYDVWYRAYVQDYGWLGWASDGARAGTTGIGYRVEALQVRVLAKGSAAPGPTDGAYRDVADEKVIGVPRIRLVTWLTQHQYDGYYLGTPYSTGFSIPTCTYPNGERRWDGYSGMNCTGFVAHAWSKCGGNLAAVAANNSHSPWAGGPGGGGYINAWRFYGYAIDSGSKVYEFNKVQDLLNSGLARKGDVIFFKTAPNVDCHIGFFWGDNPRDNKMWHSSSPANQISSIYNYSNPAEINQHVCLIK